MFDIQYAPGAEKERKRREGKEEMDEDIELQGIEMTEKFGMNWLQPAVIKTKEM